MSQVRNAAVWSPQQRAMRPPQCTAWSGSTADSLAASLTSCLKPTLLARSSLRSVTSRQGPLSLLPSADAAAASVAALLLRLCRPAALEPRTEAGRLPRLATELVRDGSLISGTLSPTRNIFWSAGLLFGQLACFLLSHQQVDWAHVRRVPGLQ